MTVRDTSTCAMWIGVITITATMQVCATAIANRPSTAPGWARMTSMEWSQARSWGGVLAAAGRPGPGR